MKRTKIVCTIGPASASGAVLEKMVRAGMNVARLNMSHGTHEAHAKLIKAIRAVSKKTKVPIAIMADLQGPKVRVGDLPKEGVMLKAGAKVIFTTAAKSTLPKISVSWKGLHKDVKKGDRFLLDDGLLEVRVLGVKGKDITAKVLVGGLLTSHKGLNVPTATLGLSSITAKDLKDARFGVKMEVDAIALSFVRSAAEIRKLRRSIALAEKAEKKAKRAPIMIIAKIEKHEALTNLQEIIDVADGIMIARGDLAIETPAADVPIHQKGIIQKCLAAAKPVIVATQMLDSMMRNPRPTRAEISDVANAIIDHTDAVMLSGESATGNYPAESVRTMTTIAMETEHSVFDNLHLHMGRATSLSSEEAIGQTAGLLARNTDAKAIVASSISGTTAREISRFRPEIPIFVGTNDARVLRQMNFSWGVFPFHLGRARSAAALEKSARGELRRLRVLKPTDHIIYVSGVPGKQGETNQVAIERLG